MLGRRQVREKVMQSVYAHKISDQTKEVTTSNFLKGIDEIHELYVYLLNLLPAIKNVALGKIEKAKAKQMPTEEDLNPNYKFVNNKLFDFVESNKEISKLVEKNSKLLWSEIEVYPERIFSEFIQSEKYLNYMQGEGSSFEKDKKLILHLFDYYIADNEKIHDFLEDEKLHWSDGIYIANSMVRNTLVSLHAKSDPSTQIYTIFKDEKDREFGLALLQKTLEKQKEIDQIIVEKAENWKLDRIAAIDLIVLELGLCELLYFMDIPANVTINEYVEMVKNYSSEKSKIFVNGILDKVLKDYREQGKILK
ncbi:MAG: transcription antitermination factor NusB [Flavobacteriaceae bacterium]|nr:MAG: transcription antitermination factor NusB [Flavobacteriaceae bacterium]